MNSIEFRLHINITLSSVRHIVVFEHSRVVIHTLVSIVLLPLLCNYANEIYSLRTILVFRILEVSVLSTSCHSDSSNS